MPSSAYEAKGLLKTAIRDDNPVVIFEDKLMYQDKADVPEDEYLTPFGFLGLEGGHFRTSCKCFPRWDTVLRP